MLSPGLTAALFAPRPWSPARLGSSLLGWWDAERSDLITQSGGAVSSWKDVIGGYNTVQATGSQRPVYSGTSFNGRPGITFDGVDDYLSLESVPLPSASSPCEIWAAVDQTALAADATIRCVMSYGGTGGSSSRRLRRNVSGTNIADGIVGDGASFSTPTNTADFSGRHVARLIVGATSSGVDLDGSAGSAVAVVPVTGTTRVRLGASPADTASQFFQGAVSAVLVTSPLTAGQSAQLYTYLKTRGSIA